MNEDIRKIISNRMSFTTILCKDREKLKLQYEHITTQLDDTKKTIENVKELSAKVEHFSLLKLSKKVYAFGKIVHTGEYAVELSPNTGSYTVLLTLAQTLQYLQNKILAQTKMLTQLEAHQQQLEERFKLITGERNKKTTNEEMPSEIHSDKGIAVKVGEFYEIFEYEK